MRDRQPEYTSHQPASIGIYVADRADDAADLREGIQVKQGQQIGTVGSTGDASPEAPHLHYEIHRMAPGDGWSKGTEINPYPILRG